jgi:sirohydrochlorin ferrochelatase
MSSDPLTAVLLIAHGSRHAEANADTFALAEALARDEGYPIAVAAFLEQAEPDIDTGASICVQRGARQIILLPHFLSAGVHVRRDLAAARKRLAERFADVEFRLAEPIGPHPDLVAVLAQRARQACELCR